MRTTAVLILLLAAASVGAQSVRLRQLDTGATAIRAQVGDTLSIEVAMDFGDLRASGVALHVRLPAQGLAVINGAGPRPFTPALFAEGLEFANQQVSADRIYGLPAGSALLTYAVVLGPSASPTRFRSGTGTVATFDIVCTAPVSGSIFVTDSAAHQSMVVLDDGRTERAMKRVTQIDLTVGEPAGKRSLGTWAGLKMRRR